MKFVLLIEDDKDIRETILEFLAMEDIEGVACGDGVEALEYLKTAGSRMPGLILTDMNMPRMDGPAFRTAQLAEPSLRDIPCIALSADNRAQSYREPLKLAGIVKKPIDLDQLMAVITKSMYRAPHAAASVSASANVPNSKKLPEDDTHDLINEISAAKMHLELLLRDETLALASRTRLQRVVEKIDSALKIVRLRDVSAQAREAVSDPILAEPGAKKTVLLLDDSTDLGQLFTAYLTPRGYRISTATDVDAALVILKNNALPDLLLLDFHLAQVDASQALDRLEAACPELFTHSKVVLFTSDSQVFSDRRLFAREPKAQDLAGIERVVRKYT